VFAWWPGVSTELENLDNGCPICYKFQNQPTKSLILFTLPALSWQKVASDLFKWKGTAYLIVVDSISKSVT